MPVTLCTMLPYRMERAPDELLAVMPPMVARSAVDGSTGKNSPSRASVALSRPSTTPGCTRARRAATSIDSTARRFLLTSTTIAALTVWPHCDVPAPRGKIGIPASAQIARTARMSSTSAGTTTPSGSTW